VRAGHEPYGSDMGRIPLLDPAPSDGIVALRPWRESDIAAMTAACRDADIQRWTMAPDRYSEDDARSFIAYTRASRDADESLELAVADATSADEVLGAVGLVSIDWENEQAELGYWTAPHARRRGVVVRAVRLLSRWAFEELALARLYLMPYAANSSSQRVAERAGYRREGVLRSFYKSKSGLVDVVMYSMLRDDPPASRSPRHGPA
jgi:RimJ/RimL family protein N-acetyltransferase